MELNARNRERGLKEHQERLQGEGEGGADKEKSAVEGAIADELEEKRRGKFTDGRKY